MKLPLIPVEGTPASMEAPAIKTLSTLHVSALLDMLEGSVRQITMSVLLARDTMGLCARVESIATPDSVCLDTKAGIVTCKWMKVFLIPV